MFAEVRVVVVAGGVLDDEIGGVARVEELGDLVVGMDSLPSPSTTPSS